jgi:hypothetical protein
MNTHKNHTNFSDITVEKAATINGGFNAFEMLGNISSFIRWSPLRIIRTKR